MVGRQFADHEGDKAEDAERGENADVVGREPVFTLSGVEQELQRADAKGEESDAPEIDLAVSALDVVRIDDEAVHQEERQDADGKIEVEDPAPIVVVGDPSAERGAENGSEQDADAIGGHGVTVALFGERLEENRLSERLKAAAGQALQYAEDDQLG